MGFMENVRASRRERMEEIADRKAQEKKVMGQMGEFRRKEMLKAMKERERQKIKARYKYSEGSGGFMGELKKSSLLNNIASGGTAGLGGGGFDLSGALGSGKSSGFGLDWLEPKKAHAEKKTRTIVIKV